MGDLLALSFAVRQFKPAAGNCLCMIYVQTWQAKSILSMKPSMDKMINLAAPDSYPKLTDTKPAWLSGFIFFDF